MNACAVHDSLKFLSGEMSDLELAEYESHLEACDQCRRRLEASSGDDDDWRSVRELLADPPLTVEPDVAAPARISLSFLAPSDDPAMLGRVGPYEIAGVVGRGGAGIVLKGLDRSLGRNVAIKVLDPALAGVGAARQRFFREAKAMAAISHEHVAPIYEVSEHADLPYLVMEYVPGGSLERRLRSSGPFDVLSIVRIGLQTAQALAAAHKQGLVHRDIKPGNILLDRGTERVRVADFGLARVANDVSFTKSGFVAGTPQYMSPEQVRAEACDAQSDLFSLGAVMYALCTGHAPFRAETVYGVMQRIVHDAPRPIREQNALIPRWLEEFILRLMEKDRAARFGSADEAARILHEELAHLQGPASAAQPARPWLGKPKTGQRAFKKRIVAGVVAAGLVCIGIFAWKLVAWMETPPNDGPAPKQSTPAAKAGEAKSLVPLWGHDGASEAMRAADWLEASWKSAPPVAPDPWEREAGDVSRRLSEIAAEMDTK
jgi:serine/threonine-protein kinase